MASFEDTGTRADDMTAARAQVTTAFKASVAAIVEANARSNAANERLTEALASGDIRAEQAALAELKEATADLKTRLEEFPALTEAMKALPPAEKDPFVPMLLEVHEIAEKR